MKIITLIPIKNEDWILEQTLENVCSFSDHVIIADQQSTDRSLEICKKFDKVRVVINNSEGHSNSVRWALLDEARKIEGNNFIFCIDADEIISPKFIGEIKTLISNNILFPGMGVSFQWIQIWGSMKTHRVDGVWRNNIKVAGFYDDRMIDYKREFVINDHTSRIPQVSKILHIAKYPLLHIQSISYERYIVKQAWYRCNELIASPTQVKKINHKYSVSNTDKLQIEDINEEWLNGVSVDTLEYSEEKDWRYVEILSRFDKYGITFFEPLQIWDIKKLHDMFVEKTGRKPKAKTFFKVIVIINNLKNLIINFKI
ncbi:MAG: glycosyltransferase [Patescibacteria group bacterium]